MVGAELTCGRVWMCVCVRVSQLGCSWGAELGAKLGQRVQEETLKRPKVTAQSQKGQVHVTSLQLTRSASRSPSLSFYTLFALPQLNPMAPFFLPHVTRMDWQP